MAKFTITAEAAEDFKNNIPIAIITKDGTRVVIKREDLEQYFGRPVKSGDLKFGYPGGKATRAK